MKYYIISGERSGDLHASNLISAIKSLDPNANFRGMGGDYSRNEGLSLAAHFDEVAVMGFVEVLLGFRKVLKYLSLIKKDILKFKPDVLVLVDYGGFNMKMAAFGKENKIPVHYYIPPKVWAWNQKRAFKIKEFTDQVYSILPFEPPFFKKFEINAHYVGNPLLDEISKFEPHPFFHQKNSLSYSPVIALLPGSRKQELANMMHVMLQVVKKFPNAQFVIAGVDNLGATLYEPAIKAGIKVIYNQTYDLLHHANAAIVTSGTATLETALFRVPQVVVYKTSGISYAIAKRLIRVPFISLVNLIADRKVVAELIQNDYSVENLSQELNLILSNILHKAEILDGYTEIKEKLGTNSASETTARMICSNLEI
ncbi:lipid-A-disaccharide synthase [Aquiflexum gelatinilyticum]|uniref:lipid-A-disaccharide synthase n=1 Tax=Aquiflexum gelatinilyticum TaxID=2961943 RepID=UPI002166CB4A|nr:lipid-A-disaccharide synthase [Aquiflexum gelatinilyticum]MCS4436764.1 lipid-A-disaccharide synthase [Aquiflexum gelatinilyticum]